MSEKFDNRNVFTEMLEEIGSEYAPSRSKLLSEFSCEEEFKDFDENERGTEKCTLTYRIAKRKEHTSEALKYLFAYSNRTPDMDGTSKMFLDSVIKTLTELLTYDTTKVKGGIVKYHQIVDALNEINKYSSLYDLFVNFSEEWSVITSTYEMKNIPSYMKSCLAEYILSYGVSGTVSEMQARGTAKTAVTSYIVDQL